MPFVARLFCLLDFSRPVPIQRHMYPSTLLALVAAVSANPAFVFANVAALFAFVVGCLSVLNCS